MDTCLDTTDREGNRVIFVEANRVAKEDKHPELRSPAWIDREVRKAIESPDFIYEDLNDPDARIACYALEYEYFGQKWYAKVTVLISSSPRRVITAYRAPQIKERTRKCKLLYGKPI